MSILYIVEHKSYRNVKSIDRNTLVLVYNALIQPYFDYCCKVWDTLGKDLSERLQKIAVWESSSSKISIIIVYSFFELRKEWKTS